MSNLLLQVGVKAGATLLMAASLCALCEPARAAVPTPGELAMARQWALGVYQNTVPPPFSFLYGGKTSGSWLKTWQIHRATDILDAQRTQLTITYTEPQTHLQVQWIATQYTDFPAIEWVVTFHNTGAQDTPILENVHSADFPISTRSGDFTVRSSNGSHAQITDYEPHEATLGVGNRLDLMPYGGRSSDGVFPFFNVVRAGGGLVLGVGWSGQWAASFQRATAKQLIYQAGMAQTHLMLHPGEQIRTPATLLVFYQGDPVRGHNLLRSLLLRHYTPTPGGRRVDPPIAASGATIGFNNVSAANQIQAIRNIAANKLPVDTYWIDAGWSTGGFPLGMGTWDPDPTRFPNGLKPVADAAHQAGLKFLLWFEPERVMPNTWLRLNHPEWLLTPANLPPEQAYQSDWRLLNLGDPNALTWAIQTFSGMISETGIDIYRHDFNMHPLYYWRANEAPDRQGIHEIRYIEGLYTYLDTLKKENPNILLDNSASGGRRIDFEWLRRSIPLLRTDYLWDPVGAQSMTYGLSYWVPIHGQGAVSIDPDDFRSGMGSTAVYAFDFYTTPSAFWSPLTTRIQEYSPIQPLFSGDFYPLTSYSVANDVWIAWQFDRADLGQGLVQAFRRANSTVTSAHYLLCGLKARTRYTVTDSNSGSVQTMTGRQLMAQGIAVSLPAAPGSALITYRVAN